MALALPRTITVVTGGAKDAKKFNELFQGDEDEWVTIDLRPHLKKNPGDAIGYKADSSHVVTQQVVMSQSGSPEVVKYIIKMVEGGGGDDGPWESPVSKLFIHCQHGWHRADTIGHIVESYLNAMHNGDERCFNCKRFALHDALGAKGWNGVVDCAMKWAEAPWTMADVTGSSKASIFGYEACKGHPVASANWDQLYEHMCSEYRLEPAPRVEVKRMRVKTGKSSSSAKPAAPVVAPAASKRLPWMAASSAAPPPPPPPAWMQADPPRAAKGEVAEAVDDDDALPSWATFESRVDVWYDVLKRMKVDENAIQSTFLLAQHSKEGFMGANQVISKLLKKEADGDPPRNASAFVHTIVEKHRNRIDPWKR